MPTQITKNVSLSLAKIDEVLTQCSLPDFISFPQNCAFQKTISIPQESNKIAFLVKGLTRVLTNHDCLVAFYDIDIFESSSLLDSYSFLRTMEDPVFSNEPGVLIPKNSKGFLETLLGVGLISSWDMLLVVPSTKEVLFFSHDGWIGANLTSNSDLARVME